MRKVAYYDLAEPEYKRLISAKSLSYISGLMGNCTCMMRVAREYMELYDDRSKVKVSIEDAPQYVKRDLYRYNKPIIPQIGLKRNNDEYNTRDFSDQ